jgi:hypothetical protein
MRKLNGLLADYREHPIRLFLPVLAGLLTMAILTIVGLVVSGAVGPKISVEEPLVEAGVPVM